MAKAKLTGIKATFRRKAGYWVARSPNTRAVGSGSRKDLAIRDLKEQHRRYLKSLTVDEFEQSPFGEPFGVGYVS
jgi:hypothetical protein